MRASPSALFVPCQLPDRACFLSPIVLSLRGELDYANLEVIQLGLSSESLCQLPSAPLYVSVQTALRGPAVWSGVDDAVPLSVFVGRMIRTTPSSRLKALASPCQLAERLQ